MKNPLVSVVMPVYNNESYLKESVNSILSQTYPYLEFIIINDGSTDKSAEIITNIKDKRIIFINHSTNKGNYFRRNEGCKLAMGKYICIMDSDDIAFPKRIERQIYTMENNPSILAHGTAFIFSNGNICHKPCNYDLIKVRLLFNNMFLHPSLIIRKSTLELIGYYNEYYRYSSDYDLVCKIATKGKIINIPEILMKYRIHENQISSAYYTKQLKFANQIRLDYLEKCGFNLSIVEKKLFTLMMTKSNYIIKNNINVSPIINILKKQNDKSSYFRPDIFNSFLENLISR